MAAYGEQISGPGLPYLSFYDLPGVISQAENVSSIWNYGSG